ncbi:MAG: hypothetical protein VCC01_06185 [Candidatus Hydrogenedentota bacterium]
MGKQIQQKIEYKLAVRTTSRMRACYLIYFCGQKVRSVRRTPLMMLAGIMIYSKTWILVTY